MSSRRHAAVRDTAVPVHILAAPGTSAEVRRLTDELTAHRRALGESLAREAELTRELEATRQELARVRAALHAAEERTS